MLGLILSSYTYLRSATVQFPLPKALKASWLFCTYDFQFTVQCSYCLKTPQNSLMLILSFYFTLLNFIQYQSVTNKYGIDNKTLQVSILPRFILVPCVPLLILRLYCDFISDHTHRIHHSFQSFPYISNCCTLHFLLTYGYWQCELQEFLRS